MYGTGYSHIGSILDMGVEQGIIDKSGAYFSYNGNRLGQGKENAKKFLTENPEIANEIEAKIRENFTKTAENSEQPDDAEKISDSED